jgi:hypothetical protein
MGPEHNSTSSDLVNQVMMPRLKLLSRPKKLNAVDLVNQVMMPRQVVKSAKEIECCQYKSTFAIFSSGLTFARFICSKTNLMIPGHVLHS